MTKITLVKSLAGLTVQVQAEADIEVAEEAPATEFTGQGCCFYEGVLLAMKMFVVNNLGINNMAGRSPRNTE